MEKIETIKAAINEAKGAGSCSYAAPCVIGQIFAIEGYTKEQLEELDRMRLNPKCRSAPSVSRLGGHSDFLVELGYDLSQLQTLQFVWDCNPNEARARLLAHEKLLEIVEKEKA